MSAFTVTFVNNDEDSTKDNVLKITLNKNKYIWSYKDAQLSYAEKVKLYSPSAVYNLLETLLEMACYDKQPAKFIQVDVPAFPSIYVSHYDLYSMKHTILDALHFTMKAWPRVKLPPIPASPETPRKHLVFDDC